MPRSWGGGQAPAELHREVQRGRQRQWRSPNVGAKRVSLQQLDGDVRHALVVADVVNCQDVGMRQRGNRARFAIEPLTEGGVGRPAGGPYLDRDLPL